MIFAFDVVDKEWTCWSYLQFSFITKWRLGNILPILTAAEIKQKSDFFFLSTNSLKLFPQPKQNDFNSKFLKKKNHAFALCPSFILLLVISALLKVLWKSPKERSGWSHFWVKQELFLMLNHIFCSESASSVCLSQQQYFNLILNGCS